MVDVKFGLDRAAFAVVQSFGALVAVSLEDSLPSLAPLASGAAAAGSYNELAVLRAPAVVRGVIWAAWFSADADRAPASRHSAVGTPGSAGNAILASVALKTWVKLHSEAPPGAVGALDGYSPGESWAAIEVERDASDRDGALNAVGSPAEVAHAFETLYSGVPGEINLTTVFPAVGTPTARAEGMAGSS